MDKRRREKNEGLQKEIDEQIEKGIQELFNRWMRWSCKTSAVAIMGFCMLTGRWCAYHYDRVMHAMIILFGNDK